MAEMAISNSSLSPSILPQQDQASNELEAIACLNIATCYIKLNNPRQALEHANKSISLKPANWKAHLRKGEALVMLGDCDNARTTLDVARSLTTESAAIAAISNENKKLSCKIKEQNQKMKKAFAGIFSKSVPLDEVGALSDSSAK